jgi:hypothetical protein
MPNCPPAEPSLTAAALSVRAADIAFGYQSTIGKAVKDVYRRLVVILAVGILHAAAGTFTVRSG